MSFFTIDPFRELTRMHADMDRMYNAVMGDTDFLPSLEDTEERKHGHKKESQLSTKQAEKPLVLRRLMSWSPRWDIHESPEKVEIQADLPGVRREDVKIEMKNGCLALSGKKEQAKEEKTGDYQVRERSYGSFFRAVRLPENVDESCIKAKFADGVLNVTVPKVERKENVRMITID